MPDDLTNPHIQKLVDTAKAMLFIAFQAWLLMMNDALYEKTP